jgi:hypothetical protein
MKPDPAMADVPLPPPPEPRTPGGSRFLHRLQAALALVIALAAIGLTAWEGIENRRHNRLSVRPRLGAEIETGRDGSEHFARMAIEGTGLGPAVIGTFRVYFDGVAQDSVTANNNPWQKAMDLLEGTSTQLNAHGLGEGYYFPAGRRYVLFEARRALGASPEAPPLTALLDRLAVQICYCSIYGTDCDEVLLTTSRIQPLACRQ